MSEEGFFNTKETLTFQQYVLYAFKNLQEESTRDGLGEFYEDGLDHLWNSIPTMRKRQFQRRWDEAEAHRPEPGMSDVERNKVNRERCKKKMQIISDTLDMLGLLFMRQDSFTQQLFLLGKQALEEEREGVGDDVVG